MTDKTDREIMQQALEAMMDSMRVSGGISDKMFESVNAISERLAQPEREWQGLTDEEIYECEKVGAIHYQRHKCSVRGQQLTPADDPQWHFAGAIEAKLKEKND